MFLSNLFYVALLSADAKEYSFLFSVDLLHCPRQMQNNVQLERYCNLTLLFILFNFDSAVSVLLCELTGRIKIISLGEASSIARVHGAGASSWRHVAISVFIGLAIRPRPSIFIASSSALPASLGVFLAWRFAVLAASHSAVRRKGYRLRATWRRLTCRCRQRALGVAWLFRHRRRALIIARPG